MEVRNYKLDALKRFVRDILLFYLLHPYILYLLIILWGAGETINIFDSILITVSTVALLFLIEKIKIIHFLIK